MTKPIRLDMLPDADDRDQPGIECLERYTRMAVTTDGHKVLLMRFFDRDGNDCKPEWARSCVGKDRIGRWWSIDLNEFQEQRSH